MKINISDNQCYVIAEIGSNHNNDLSLAKESIFSAKEAGANAAKFQAFKAENHYSKYTPGFNYLDSADTYKLIQSLEINRDWHNELIDYCNKLDIDFISSPCDFEAVDQLDELGMEIFKVASFDVTDTTLINHIANKRKKTILSCGMASLADIELAVTTITSVGAEKPVLLQCTSLYPAPVELSNLKAMSTLKQAFDCDVGYSDHTLGINIPIAAVALGAKVIEKHFTTSNELDGPDHNFALEPDEFANMVSGIRDVEKSLGDGLKHGPREEENEMYEKGRRSIHAAKDLKKGDKLSREDLIIKRPGYGLPVPFLDFIIGRTILKDIKRDQWITKDMI